MLDHSYLHCRCINSEENFPFSLEYGIKVFVEKDFFQKCMICGHIDNPIEMKELIDYSTKEKRNNPHSVHLLYLQLMDIY